MMTRASRCALVVGCHGGVGRAVLSLLEHSAPGRRLRERFDRVLLVDREPPHAAPPLEDAVLLPPTAVASADDLARLIRQHRVTHVVDLSSVDTVDCTRACDECGAHFLSTSVEEWPGQSSVSTDEAIARLLPPRRPALTARGHLVGSGANPGIVNALVFTTIDAFASRVGVAPTVDALELYAVLITEEDTTVETGMPEFGEVFAMTWSPLHCLEELFEPRAFAARDGRVVGLGHRPTRRWYSARCGDHVIDGMAVPHEEIATLASRLRTVEIGFVYRIPRAGREPLARHPQRDSAEVWSTRRMWPPWSNAITGEDRVGVLLCSRRFGELWMGFETDVAAGLAFGTNATQLQVAAGVVAGWMQLGKRAGIHFVEDLDCREFIDIASEVLGPVGLVYDADAPPRSFSDRGTSPAEVGVGA
jgi:homospermidine synthase